MKKARNFFGVFKNNEKKNIKTKTNPPNTFPNYIDKKEPNPKNLQNEDSHHKPKLNQTNPLKPDGDFIIITDSLNDLGENPDSFNRLKGFSIRAEDICSEKKESDINQSLYLSKRDYLFNNVTKQLFSNTHPLKDPKDSNNSKAKDASSINEILPKNLKENPNKFIKEIESKNMKDKDLNKDNNDIKTKNEDNKNNKPEEGLLEQLRKIFDIAIKNVPWNNYKWRIIKPLFICYFLSLNCSIYGNINIGLYNGVILAILLAKMMQKIFEVVVKEIQYIGILKGLQFHVDKERKQFISQNMKIDNQQDIKYLRSMVNFGSPLLGIAVFPLILTELYSFAVILQCLIIWLYFILICLIFRYKNNRKVQSLRIIERKITYDFRLKHQSKLVLKDLSSTYLRFLQDFEKTKLKILESSAQKNEDSKSDYSNYIRRKTLEVGIQKNKFFHIDFRSIFESFFCFVFIILLVYLNYLLIYAFLLLNLPYILAILLGLLFISYRELIRLVIFHYFHYQKLFKIFITLIPFSYLFPHKLMFFSLATFIPSNDINDFFTMIIILFMIKLGLKIAYYLILGLIWVKFRAYIQKNDQNRKESRRKTKNKNKKLPESMGGTHFFWNNIESLNEFLDKRCKEYSVSFFVYNFSDFIISFVIFISSITLRYIPKTRWNMLKFEIYQTYLQYIGIDFGVEIIVLAMLFLFLRRFNILFERKEWMMDGINYFKKRGEIYMLGLYFMFYLNFYCFELFFLFPFNDN